MHAIDPDLRDWPLSDAAQSRALEHAAQARLPPHTLMQRAGEAVARLALAIAPHAARFVACAGPGNNGGDAFEAAAWLRRCGRTVVLHHWGDAARLPPDAARSLARAREAGAALQPIDAFRPQPDDLILDGLLGLGLTRAPAGPIADAIARINDSPARRLAIDLPSGLDGDTGCVVGDQALRADATLALLTLKPGLWTADGRDHAGRIWFDDLGVASAEPPSARLLGGPDRWRAAPREHRGHKGRYGDVQVIGGADGMSGAALLAARAALAAGAGRVYLALLSGTSSLDTTRPELMLRPPPGRPGALPLTQGWVLCGCGGGDAVREGLPAVLDEATALVLDADALNAIASDSALAGRLQARAARRAPTVLTPHPLEAARLLGSTTAAVQADRLGAATALAARCGATVVLKGSGTVVAAPGRAPVVNPTGSAALATAGTGDVLAGWLAGLWAQADGLDADSARVAAENAVYQHGRAAQDQPAPLRAADLVERLHAQRSVT